MLLNTFVTVTLYDAKDPSLLDKCLSLCGDYERIFSRTDPESELYELNEKRSVEASPELLELLELCLEYCRISGGAFDVTLGRISDMYAFSSDSPRVPAQSNVEAALEDTGYEHIHISGSTVSLDEGFILDLGAAAKGYIADKMAQFLVSNGQESAIIDLGGNILCVGSKPGREDFRVGIQCPFKERSETICTVAGADISVVTSGIYERGFEQDGVYYHHILDPKTGEPCRNGLLAVSIVSESSVLGDILSTACFVMGLEKGMELIDSTPEAEAVFVTEDMQLHFSGGFEDFLAA